MIDEIDNILDLFTHCTNEEDCSECCLFRDGSCAIRNPLDWETDLDAYAKEAE